MNQLNSDLKASSKIPTLRGMQKMPLISNKLSGHKSGSVVVANCVVRKLSDKSTSEQNSSCVDRVNSRKSETKRPIVVLTSSSDNKKNTNQSALPKSRLYK